MSATELKDLLEQRAAIEKKIASVQRQARQDAVNRVRAMMAEYGLTLADLSGKTATPKAKVSKVPVKYRDAATGATWTGRGLKPKWLTAALASGRKLQDFAV